MKNRLPDGFKAETSEELKIIPQATVELVRESIPIQEDWIDASEALLAQMRKVLATNPPSSAFIRNSINTLEQQVADMKEENAELYKWLAKQ